MGKNEIVEGAAVPENKFKALVDSLKEKGLVEQIGERRGPKYRVTDKGRKAE